MLRPLVTVVLTTFNHQRFVRESLEGVLAQETTFPFEVVVVDDCSTDGTVEIVDGFVQRYPGKVTREGPDTNRCDNLAFSQAILRARGRYVAILDGDDYWTSPAKLQMQVDFLERHPDCTTSFHNVALKFEDGSTGPAVFNPPNQPRFSTLEDLWERNFIATCSAMFRQGLLSEFPAWYQHAKWGDWALHILNAEHGRIGYIPAVLGVYRIHASGFWSQLSDVAKLEAVIEFYAYMNEALDFRYARSAAKGIARHRRLLVRKCEQLGDRVRARASASQYFRHVLKSGLPPLGLSVRQLLYLYAPPVHSFLRTSSRSLAALLNRMVR